MTADGGAPSQPEHGRPLYADPRLLVLFATTTIAVQGMGSVAPALPAISNALAIGAGHASWVIAVFAFPGIVLGPMLGVLADRFGRKAVLVPSLLLYGTAGTVCALAPSFEWLIALRLVQGIGAAVLNTLVFTVIGDLYHGPQRVRATGYNTGALSIAAALYPIVGGFLAGFGWQYPFLLPLLAFPVALLVWRVLDEPAAESGETLGQHFRAMAAVASRRNVMALFYTNLVVFAAVFGAFLTYAPFLLHARFGASELVIGLVFAANAAFSAVLSLSLGAIARRLSYRTIILGATAVLAGVMAAFPFLPTIWLVAGAAALVGAVMGTVPASAVVQLLETDSAQRGSIVALNGTMFRTGQTLGPLAAAAMFALAGFEGLYLAVALLVLTSFAAAWHGLGAARRD